MFIKPFLLTALVLVTTSALSAGDVLSKLPGESPTAYALRSNPLRTREDVAKAMCDIYEPLRAYRVPDGFHLGETGAYYSPGTIHCEAFLRPLWGLVPMAAGGGAYFKHWAEWRATLIAATDPQNPAFWHLVKTSGDQRAVEMAAIATGLLLAPQEMWEPLHQNQRQNLMAWISSIEKGGKPKNNWIFFRVLVQLAMQRLGQPIDVAQNADDLAAIDKLYLADGWYSDGPSFQRDYYIPMAMHYYGLIYAMHAQNIDPERCARYRERAALFARDFQHWFTPEGDALPYGRSLTYRYAQAAFWSALAYAKVEVEGLSIGQVKGLLLRNLRWWFRQPIFTQGGTLSIGYTYPNMLMSETYNAPGSPYWASKAFIALALPLNDPFWQVAEEALPARPAISVQPHAGMVLTHDDKRSHTVALTSGQLADFMRVSAGSKYAKFAYSTAFGFSVLGNEGGVGGGGFDSTLALSDDNQHYRSREYCKAVVVRGSTLASRWNPWSDVTVETWLAPFGAGHVRIHHLVTPRPMTVCDGGFSIPITLSDPVNILADDQIVLASSLGLSAVRDLSSGAKVESILVRPNLNVLHSRVRMPGAMRKLEAGDYWLATAVVGIPDPAAAAEVQATLSGLSWVPGPVPSIVSNGKIVLTADPIPEKATLTTVTPR